MQFRLLIPDVGRRMHICNHIAFRNNSQLAASAIQGEDKAAENITLWWWWHSVTTAFSSSCLTLSLLRMNQWRMEANKRELFCSLRRWATKEMEQSLASKWELRSCRIWRQQNDSLLIWWWPTNSAGDHHDLPLWSVSWSPSLRRCQMMLSWQEPMRCCQHL